MFIGCRTTARRHESSGDGPRDEDKFNSSRDDNHLQDVDETEEARIGELNSTLRDRHPCRRCRSAAGNSNRNSVGCRHVDEEAVSQLASAEAQKLSITAAEGETINCKMNKTGQSYPPMSNLIFVTISLASASI